MKRKADNIDALAANGHGKKQATEKNSSVRHFREGLFAPSSVKEYTDNYANSGPYRHGVVSNIINDSLLRSVRSEVLENIHFTPKETDIYKIHQSGDLANLDGLDEFALKKLPSLLKIRDALYSHDFRQWLSTVTGAGLLSGTKTDMAMNVYVPGCHLLCHDDVIGTRRVSYILYLTNPDLPWKAEWGGALRLYPTDDEKDNSGKTFKVPRAEWSKSIPPAWNQMSFFAVQPGESFHDVEEVYHPNETGMEVDRDRFRMAISGWFHIPQEGEEGFEPGLEEKLAERSSLQQLQGRADQLDLHQPQWHDPELPLDAPAFQATKDDPVELSEADLEFLLKYITPNYLTPDTVEELNEIFSEESMAQLSNFFNTKFADGLREQLQDGTERPEEDKLKFDNSRPPHKHRYQYVQSQPSVIAENFAVGRSPFVMLLDELLPSLAFRKWLSLVTGLTLKKCSVIARRFRRGMDYELAQAYEGEDPQLEYTLCVTPSLGWGGEDEVEGGDAAASNGTATRKVSDDDNVGGYELYMAGEDAEDDNANSDDGVEIPAKMQSQTGAGERRNASRRKADPAIYSAAKDNEDDGILVSNPASWNTLSIVLRDKGTLRFVKYVSRSAPGDRYDFAGCVEVEPDDEVSDGEEGSS